MKSNAPYESFKAVTPHDTNVLTDHDGTTPITSRGLVCTVSGLISCRQVGTETIVAVPAEAGKVLPIVTDLIHTDSTATGIVALW